MCYNYFGMLLCLLWAIEFPRIKRFSPIKGGSKHRIWYIAQPIAQMSILKLYGWCFISSGARYRGVPTLVPCKGITEFTILDTPRSPSLICLSSVMNMFKVLISLCIISLEWRYSIPRRISYENHQISFSDHLFLLIFVIFH